MSEQKKAASEFLLTAAEAPAESVPQAKEAPTQPPAAGLPAGISMEQLMGMFLQMQANNQQLTEMMMKREARKEKEEQELIVRIEQREKQRRLNAREFDRQKMLAQASCKHQKGVGKGSIKGPVVDYAVYLHTFIDHSQTIKCRICHMTWRPGDTRDFLAINGQKVKNHTNIGWTEAVDMTKQSTDKESSSEAPLHVDGEIALLLQGRDPSFISALLNSPEGRAFLERTKTSGAVTA